MKNQTNLWKETRKLLSDPMVIVSLAPLFFAGIVTLMIFYAHWEKSYLHQEFCTFTAKNSQYTVVVEGTLDNQAVVQINKETGERMKSWWFTNKNQACDYAHKVAISLQGLNGGDHALFGKPENDVPYGTLTRDPRSVNPNNSDFGLCGGGDPETWFYPEYIRSKNKLPYEPQTQGALINPDKDESTFRQSSGISSRTY